MAPSAPADSAQQPEPTAVAGDNTKTSAVRLPHAASSPRSTSLKVQVSATGPKPSGSLQQQQQQQLLLISGSGAAVAQPDLRLRSPSRANQVIRPHALKA